MTNKIDGDTFRWIFGSVVGLLSTVGGIWLSNLTASITDLRQDMTSLGRQQSALTARDEAQNKLLDRVDQRFERIEQKIDLLLAEKRSRQ